MLTRFVASDEGVDCFGGEPQASPRFHDKRKALIVAVEPARRAAEAARGFLDVEKAVGLCASVVLTTASEHLKPQAQPPPHALEIPEKSRCVLERDLGDEALERAQKPWNSVVKHRAALE